MQLFELAYHTCLLVAEADTLPVESLPTNAAAMLLPELCVAAAVLLRYACGSAHGWSAVAAASGAVPGGEVTRAVLDAVSAALHAQSIAVEQRACAPKELARAAIFAEVALDGAMRLLLEPTPASMAPTFLPRIRPHTGAHVLSTRPGPFGDPPQGMHSLLRLCLAALSSCADEPHRSHHVAHGATLLASMLVGQAGVSLTRAIAHEEELAALAEPCFRAAVDNMCVTGSRLLPKEALSFAAEARPPPDADAIVAALALRIASLRLCCTLLTTTGLQGAVAHSLLPFICSAHCLCAPSTADFARRWGVDAAAQSAQPAPVPPQQQWLNAAVEKLVYGIQAATPVAEQAALLCTLLAGLMQVMRAHDVTGDGAAVLAQHIRSMDGVASSAVDANLSCLLSRAAADADGHDLVAVYQLLSRLRGK